MSSRNASRLARLALRAGPRGLAATAGAPTLRSFAASSAVGAAAPAFGLAGAPRAGGLLPDAARALAAVSAVRAPRRAAPRARSLVGAAPRRSLFTRFFRSLNHR
jgi:hypothetical protein